MRGPFRRSIGDTNQWRPRDSFARIIDGTSNQFFVGEKHISQVNLGLCNKSSETSLALSGDCSYLDRTPAMARATAHWNWDYASTPIWFALAISPTDTPTTSAYQSEFGSYHPGICQFLFGDGVVRGVSVATPVEPILVPAMSKTEKTQHWIKYKKRNDNQTLQRLSLYAPARWHVFIAA
jgi:hypothetical protein